ncbi:response regulator [Leucobacter sp. M11]|uniref:response regulator n=1 Tax=Leucobacter sp. M11 TaxID=2993565 RepID=UPI002D8020BE|nr:response regulator [Leucobacter sp. M11]MEB4615535.1 response regulator [Leucobacter sp. M11]
MSGAGPIGTVIVDDDRAIAEVHARFVAAHDGFRVLATAHSGQDALDAVARHRPELILLDFGLPDIDGREVLRRVRSSGLGTVEVIAVTAARDLESVRFARLNGVRHYLVKPFSARELRSRLDEVAAHRAEQRQAPTTGLAQSEVDAMLTGGIRTVSPTAVSPLPKGLSAVSLDRVRAALRELGAPGQGAAPDASAAELALIVGMSRVSVRRYLEFLVAIGDAELTPRYGQAGRPEHRYRGS